MCLSPIVKSYIVTIKIDSSLSLILHKPRFVSRRPETRQLEQKVRAHAMTRMLTAIFSCRPPYCQVCNLAKRGSADAKFHINVP